MTDKALTIPIPEEVRNRFSKIKLKDVRKILIASSVTPQSIVAASILCRSFLRANTLFHVLFFDSILKVEQLDRHLTANPEALVVAVGLDIVGAAPDHHKHLVCIGSRFHPKLEGFRDTQLEVPVAVEAVAFAEKIGAIQREEVGLAAVGSLLQNPANETTRATVSVCTKERILVPRKGFKIPGFNFLAMDEVFSNNIHPYLDSLSGAPESCQRIFEEADISFNRWSLPLSRLSPDEARQLNAILFLSLSTSAIPYVLGSDYELHYEKEASPLRHLSSISSISRVIWSRHEMGLLLGVLIGDRARLLGSVLGTYRQYCKETISSVAEINVILNESEGKAKFHDSYIHINASNLSDITLPDVGRIVLESEIAKDIKFIVMDAKDSIIVVWKEHIPLLQVLVILLKNGIPFTSASTQAVRILDVSEERREGIIGLIRNLTME